MDKKHIIKKDKIKHTSKNKLIKKGKNMEKNKHIKIKNMDKNKHIKKVWKIKKDKNMFKNKDILMNKHINKSKLIYKSKDIKKDKKVIIQTNKDMDKN